MPEKPPENSNRVEGVFIRLRGYESLGGQTAGGAGWGAAAKRPGAYGLKNLGTVEILVTRYLPKTFLTTFFYMVTTGRGRSPGSMQNMRPMPPPPKMGPHLG
jgi:hypothetical protein